MELDSGENSKVNSE